MHTRHHAAIISLIAGFAIGALTTPGLAQALGGGRALDGSRQTGGGRALDANSRQGGDGTNDRTTDLDSMRRFNDDVISGRASGGKSFRDFVGYRAADDFGDRTASDSLFRFQRDSAASGLGPTVRSSDALRLQFALSTGRAVNDLSPALSLALTPSRSSSAASASSLRSLRSIADFETAQRSQPTIVAVDRNAAPGTRRLLTASPLRGVASTITPTDRLSTRDPASDRLSSTTPAGSREAPERTSSALNYRVPSTSTSYASAVEPIRSNFEARRLSVAVNAPSGAPATGPAAAAGDRADVPATGDNRRTDPDARPRIGSPEDERLWREELARLRERLARDQTDELSPRQQRDAARLPWREALARANTPATLDAGARLSEAERESPGTSAVDRARERAATARRENSLTPPILSAAAIADSESLMKALEEAVARGPRLDRLLPPGISDQEAFVRLTSMGQADLAQQRYFDAEGSFSRALGLEGVEPGAMAMARVGLSHAQLGAELFLSAAGNIETLLREHPELAGTRYSPEAFVPPARASELAATLAREIRMGVASRQAGLLLAYIGFQSGNAEWRTAGLSAMADATDPRRTQDAALYELVRRIWSAGGEAPAATTPPTAPAAPAAPANP